MADTVLLEDHATRDDLRIFLERLGRAGQPEVRVTSRGRALAVYGCTQAPRGLTDPVPVVLVMRAFALAEAPVPIDSTVAVRALLDRIARLGIVGLALELPEVTAMAAWSGVLPPVSGWDAAGALDAPSLRRVADEGIGRVAALLPEEPGEAVVQRVRASVWGAQIAPGVPAAAAFAAEVMGFLRDEERVALSRSVTWTRLSARRGHVLVRSLLG
ncbi:hypothetical protein MUN78_05925 [Leucobacter allii]|uniref:Uncharacterized protein n=1 Tax=Leucobacter allii TaxID=2932247 RepID=A0ABY4FQ25_9MICO|nr:hypothetical protein [Leucobacter allii]UOQ58372.1 hypothetical protein MUN78_05925 [Leucobacter allii]UOR02951.1 hypothetical protein MUN77_06535 [Leucobacter allii]